jgi:hypothetical protein
MDHRMTRIAACLLALLTTSTHAATLKEMFPIGEQRCMAFSAPNAKPGETESFEMFKLFGPNDVEEHISGSVEEEAKKLRSYDSISLDVQARFKGDHRAYWQVLGCFEENGAVRCSVDCDGGAFTGKFDKEQFKMSLDGNGFVLQGGCGDEGETTRMMTNKDAPRGLTLTKRDLAHCEAARVENYKVRLRDSVSLRKRIVDNNWRCLSRTYSDAELAKNPDQTVQQIALSILEAPKRVVDSDGANTVMQVALTAKLRDGKTATEKHECFGFTESFSCGTSFRLYRRDGETTLLKMGEFDPAPGDTPIDIKIGDVKLGDDDRLFKLEASTKVCE